MHLSFNFLSDFQLPCFFHSFSLLRIVVKTLHLLVDAETKAKLSNSRKEPLPWLSSSKEESLSVSTLDQPWELTLVVVP